MTAATNQHLADRARQLAVQCATDRRAWLCLAVIFDQTRNIAAAGKLLAEIPVAAVRDRAAELLTELQEERST